MAVTVGLRLGDHAPAVADRLALWGNAGVPRRLWDRDPTLWFPDERPELSDRLGWLGLPATLQAGLGALAAFAADVVAEGFRDAVVLGMGGSSLAPEVYQATFGHAPGHPRLRILDSTHPAAVRAIADGVDPERTLFIVSSKSGTTLETLSFFRFFWDVLSAGGSDPGPNFIAITDPGSALADLAAARGFRATFLAPPDVGGRYSALSEFGVVPAAVIGADLEPLAAGAVAAADASGPDTDPLTSPGLQLGAAMGELARGGVDKVTFVTTPALAAVPPWIEQLIAESTGKEGRGLVPVGGEYVAAPGAYGDDRFFLCLDTPEDPADGVLDSLAAVGHPVAHLRLDGLTDLGGAMFILEVAVAMAGAVLGINPFDQPDVQLAKDLARRAMAGELDTGGANEIESTDPELDDRVASWLATVSRGDYVGIQAFIRPTDGARDVLGDLRHAIRDGRRVATTVDFGPRFLHSTGQLHKGGPDTGVFLQIVDRPTIGLPVPETDYDFDALIRAQALGDRQALRSRGRRLLAVGVGDDPESGVAAIAAAVDAALR